jgi:ribosomal protein S28E/S33
MKKKLSRYFLIFEVLGKTPGKGGRKQIRAQLFSGQQSKLLIPTPT